jgi:hypothetical protein
MTVVRNGWAIRAVSEMMYLDYLTSVAEPDVFNSIPQA